MAESETLTREDTALLVVVFVLLCFLIFLVLVIFCREQLAKCCPCLVVKVKPEEKTGWHHLDRFGEVKLKSASYSVAELRARKGDVSENSVAEGSVHTNISLQVPVFEEKLHGKVTKKSVHMASDPTEGDLDTPKKKKKKRAKNSPTHGNDLELTEQGTSVHRLHAEDAA